MLVLRTVRVPCPTYFLFWKCGNLNEILRDVDLLEFVLHLYEHLCFIYGKIIFQCSFRNGKSTTVLPYKNRIKPKYLVQMKFHLNSCTFKKGNTWGMGLLLAVQVDYSTVYCTGTPYSVRRIWPYLNERTGFALYRHNHHSHQRTASTVRLPYEY